MIALLLFDEHVKPIGYVVVISVLIAVFMITIDYNSQFGNNIFRINYGDILITATTLFWAVDNNISKIVSHKMDIAKIVQLKSLIGSLLLMVIVIASSIKININSMHISKIILLGSAGFSASIFFFLHGLKSIGTERLQITLLYTIPIILGGIYLIGRKNSIIAN